MVLVQKQLGRHHSFREWRFIFCQHITKTRNVGADALNVIYRMRTSDQPRHRPSHARWLFFIICVSGVISLSAGTPALSWRQPWLAPAALKAANANAVLEAEVAPGCLNLIEGGDFEQFNPSWQVIASTRPPMYSNEQTFNNSLQSMRLGNGLEALNVESVSEVRYKPILLPYGATRIILRFLYYPLYEAAPGADLQQADLFDATTDQLLGSLLNSQEDSRTWKARDFDLTLFAGRSVSLRFRVRNDGSAGRTLMYIENVELEYCAQNPLPTYTPTGLPTPSSTPLPTNTPTLLPTTATPLTATATPIVVTSVPLPPDDPNCPNVLVNGTFEGLDGWHFGEDPVPAIYVSGFFQEGSRSVLLGNPPENPTNVVTFSSIRQLVTIPFTSGPIQLRWWRLLRTAQPGTPTATTDRQDLILLSPNLKPIQILRRELRNDGIWQEDVVDLTAYRGQTLYIYFNAFNDANTTRTWMYLDNVRLRVCGGVTVAPTLAVTPLAIPLAPVVTTSVAPVVTTSVAPLVLPSPLPTLTATLPPLPSPTITETVAAALVAPLRVPMDSPTETPTVPPTPTNNVYPLPTLPTQTVVGSPTVLAVAPTDTAASIPTAVTPIAVVSQRPLWVDRLGAVAVLASILVVIGFIVAAIINIFRRRAAP